MDTLYTALVGVHVEVIEGMDTSCGGNALELRDRATASEMTNLPQFAGLMANCSPTSARRRD